MNIAVISLLVTLFAMLLVGVPVGFAIGGATMLSMGLFSSLNMVINAQYSYSGIFSFTVMAIPFFMLAGIIMSSGGIAKRIVDFASALIGFITGSLGSVAMLACMFFGALSGSGMATTSAIGSMLIPEMKNRGYDPAYAATLVCFGGTVGPIIPPSLSFVLYGATTGVSVPDLFLAGILPGILMGTTFLIANIIYCRYTRTDVADSVIGDVSVGEFMRHRAGLVWKSFKEGFWALLSPVIILGGIYGGIFTPTEAAAVSVVYSIFVSMFIYRDMDIKGLYKAFVAAAVLNGITSFLLGYSTVFSTFMTFEGVPQAITRFLISVTDSPIVLLLLINAILLVIGMFLDTVPAVIVMAPMLLPAVKAVGVDPVHFGIIMGVNLAIGLCTPPYGCNLFVGAAVAKVKMQEMFRYIVPLLGVSIVLILIISYVPQISLFFLR